jgi:hypothetical protein
MHGHFGFTSQLSFQNYYAFINSPGIYVIKSRHCQHSQISNLRLPYILVHNLTDILGPSQLREYSRPSKKDACSREVLCVQ